MTKQFDQLPAPSAYGLPERYSQWRQYQESAVTRALASPKRYVALVAPTGFGKSVVGETIAAFNGGRSAYTVVTRPLQNQISREFPHRYDVRGRQNYDCRMLADNGLYGVFAKCDKAEALCDACHYKDKGCHYFDTIRRAAKEPAIIQNYAFWLAINKYREDGIGNFDTLILDECHEAPDQLVNSLRIEIEPGIASHYTKRDFPSQQSLADWRGWAQRHVGALRPRLEYLLAHARENGRQPAELKEVKSLVQAMDALCAAQGDWIEDRSGLRLTQRVGFEPIWPSAYSQELFRGSGRVLLMSATIRPKTLELLGVPADQYEFLEFPSSFATWRRPVIHVKTIQQRATMSDVAKMQAVNRVDQIIDGRLDRKGIIDTVSYERMQHFLAHTRHRHLMLFNASGRETQSIVERFKQSEPPCYLVTPSVGTGYDFPFDECEFFVIMKVPFPDSRSPVVAARQRADSTYGKYVAMQGIIQRAGRGMRADDDQCEVLIVDDQFVWFYFECLQLGFVPPWFAAAVQPMNQQVPRPMPKLPASRRMLNAE